MAELSSNRNLSFKIEAFDVGSEDSQSNNSKDNNVHNDYNDYNNYNNYNDKNLTKFKSKSVNVLSDEEKPKPVNINKINSTINIQNNILYINSLTPASSLDENKKKTPRIRIINRLPLFNNNDSERERERESEDSKSSKSSKSSKIRKISNSNSSSSKSSRVYIFKNEKKEMNDYCIICEEKLTAEELEKNFIECFHGFCDSCYYDYLKEKIINNKVENIKCLEQGCNTLLFDDFIQDHLKNDIPLLEKYVKFKKRRQLMLDPNIQLCPYPNCESYASKEGYNNYVQCLEGHKFCFNCLGDWHGIEKCKIDIDSKFEKWKNSKNVKRCPNCQYFVEKNEGCNHMTCINCKYEWCWLCLKESLPGHYDEGGNCEGLQYSKCQCFSNRFCVFLYHFLLHLFEILKLNGLLIIALFVFILEIIEDINNNVHPFFMAFITFYFYLIIFIYVIFALIIISILMTFYWPLIRKISDKIDNIL